MPLVYPPIATPAARSCDCPACGRDLTDLYLGASYCPGCGKDLKSIRRALRRARIISWIRSLPGRFRRSQPRDLTASRAGRPTPIVIGYSNALFRLGWLYERGGSASGNLPEAIRCYRKSARLGNLDAMVRLAVSGDSAQLKHVLPFDR